MIIDAYYLNIKSFSNRYQSGIEWSFVGGRPRAIDNGTGTGKWFSDVQVSITDRLSLDAIIAMLESYTGSSVNVNLADYEPIFGAEIDYSNPLPCYITSISSVKDTTSPLWTLTIGLGADLYDYLLPSVTVDLRVGSIQSIDRDSGHSFITGSKGSGLYGTSFAWNGKTADVEWFASRADAEILRLSLINSRSSIVNVGLALSWLFDEPSDIELGQTEYAYVLSVGECIPDISSNWYRLSATLGKAQEPVQNEPEPETFTDQRDGSVYNLVTINGLIWMAENFRNNSWGNSVENDPLNDLIFGKLYDWADANNNAPTGWRLPTLAEFEALRLLVNNNGIPLKKTTTWTIANGTDEYGFGATASGYYAGVSSYSKGEYAFIWSGTFQSGVSYYNLQIGAGGDGELVIGQNGGSSGLSVRYVKDV